ncbi:hypothetical protein EPN52_09375 [bacterium]|nr:MAG: hypothetical protein EPN52_09375 [bacterium]
MRPGSSTWRDSGHPYSEDTAISDNGQSPSGKLELEDILVVETEDERHLEYEVVGLLEDEESHESYAICYNKANDEFIVTDEAGTILEDEELAQEVLDHFLTLAEEPSGDGD